MNSNNQQWITIPSTQLGTTYSFTYQITANGAGIVQTPPSVTEQTVSDPMQEKIDAYDRAMRSVG